MARRRPHRHSPPERHIHVIRITQSERSTLTSIVHSIYNWANCKHPKRDIYQSQRGPQAAPILLCLDIESKCIMRTDAEVNAPNPKCDDVLTLYSSLRSTRLSIHLCRAMSSANILLYSRRQRLNYLLTQLIAPNVPISRWKTPQMVVIYLLNI